MEYGLRHNGKSARPTGCMAFADKWPIGIEHGAYRHEGVFVSGQSGPITGLTTGTPGLIVEFSRKVDPSYLQLLSATQSARPIGGLISCSRSDGSTNMDDDKSAGSVKETLDLVLDMAGDPD